EAGWEQGGGGRRGGPELLPEKAAAETDRRRRGIGAGGAFHRALPPQDRQDAREGTSRKGLIAGVGSGGAPPDRSPLGKAEARAAAARARRVRGTVVGLRQLDAGPVALLPLARDRRRRAEDRRMRRKHGRPLRLRRSLLLEQGARPVPVRDPGRRGGQAADGLSVERRG